MPRQSLSCGTTGLDRSVTGGAGTIGGGLRVRSPYSRRVELMTSVQSALEKTHLGHIFEIGVLGP